jgi:hypothetical protein
VLVLVVHSNIIQIWNLKFQKREHARQFGESLIYAGDQRRRYVYQYQIIDHSAKKQGPPKLHSTGLTCYCLVLLHIPYVS